MDDSVELSRLAVGMNVQFTFYIHEGEFVVSEVLPQSSDDSALHNKDSE